MAANNCSRFFFTNEEREQIVGAGRKLVLGANGLAAHWIQANTDVAFPLTRADRTVTLIQVRRDTQSTARPVTLMQVRRASQSTASF